MKVVDQYSDGGYLVFVMNDGSKKTFAAYWAMSPFPDETSKEYIEYRELLNQAKPKQTVCSQCSENIDTIFPDLNSTICSICQAQNQLDAEIFSDLELLRMNGYDKK